MLLGERLRIAQEVVDCGMRPGALVDSQQVVDDVNARLRQSRGRAGRLRTFMLCPSDAHGSDKRRICQSQFLLRLMPARALEFA